MQMVCKIDNEIELTVAQAAQEPKLHAYNRRSAREIPPTNNFDKPLWDELRPLLSTERRDEYESVKDYADSLGFTQKFYNPKQVTIACQRFACDVSCKELDIVRTPRGSWRATNVKAREILKATLMKYLPPGGLRMIHIEKDDDVHKVLSTLATSAGWSGYVRHDIKGTKKSGLKQGVAVEFRTRCAHAKKVGSFATPMMVFSRSQTSLPFSDDYKQRVPENMIFKSRGVAAVDFYQNLNEACFSRAIQDLMSKVPFYAGGINDEQTGRLLRAMELKHKYWTSIDFSHYDQSVQAWVIQDAFDILHDLFHQDADFDEDLWQIVVHDFIHKTLYGPGGELFSSRNGIPSGSMFTQIIGSICNFIMITSYLLSRGIDSQDMMIMGDDNIFFTDKHIDLVDMQGYMRATYGMTMHPHKCTSGTSTTSPEFLSREWTPRGVFRHPYKLMLRMLYPEGNGKVSGRDYQGIFSGVKFSPKDVIYAFYLSFPLGMLSLCNPDKLREWLRIYRGKNETVDPRALSGITRYRLLYQKETMGATEFKRLLAETLKVE